MTVEEDRINWWFQAGSSEVQGAQASIQKVNRERVLLAEQLDTHTVSVPAP
jgi:hypothetical protein